MPDMATHLLLQTGVNNLFVKSRHFGNAALIGTVMPDLMKPMIRWVSPAEKWWFFPLHSPVFLLILMYAAAMMFHEKDRPIVYRGLLTGAFIHLSIDMLQDSVVSSYFLFFPFSFKTFTVGLFSPEAPLQWVPILAIVVMTLYWIRRKIFKGNPGTPRR